MRGLAAQEHEQTEVKIPKWLERETHSTAQSPAARKVPGTEGVPTACGTSHEKRALKGAEGILHVCSQAPQKKPTRRNSVRGF